MHKLRNIKWLPVLMVFTIFAIAAFQYYWLEKAYVREKRILERQTNMLFRETIGQLQASKLRIDPTDSSRFKKLLIKTDSPSRIRTREFNRKITSMMNGMVQKYKESGRARIVKDSGRTLVIQDIPGDSVKYLNSNLSPGKRDRLVQFLFDVDSMQDSIRIKELETAYARRLEEQNLEVPFTVARVKPAESEDHLYNEVTVGFQNPVTYRVDLGSTTGFLLGRIAAPIIFSIFLVGFTLLSFSLLYRNLLKQRRLADIKNEFISNITHELKTTIATVSVAIEALRTFNASLDPARTKEYLDISANELQRLSLLVDKVLKLSMFEKSAIDLKYEPIDMKDLVSEVTSSMRLQFEKYHAEVIIHATDDTLFEGDRLHLVSVVFNLLDNALKYSSGNPKITIDISTTADKLLLTIADSGIGIPAEYTGRVFEKFFRVPTGNLHNAKGYGLGLSYVAHVINRHNGTIKVESVEGNGSKFIVNLPRHKA